MSLAGSALPHHVRRDLTQLEVWPWRRIGFIADVGVNDENRTRRRELVCAVSAAGGVTTQHGGEGV